MIHLGHLVNDPKKEDIGILLKEFFKVCLILQVIKILLWLLKVALVLVTLLKDSAQELFLLKENQINGWARRHVIRLVNEWVSYRVHRRYDLF